MYKMESYFLKCEKNTENIDPKISRSSNGKAMILSQCAICGSKKYRFISNQEAKGLLRKLGVKTPLSKVPYWVIFCFECVCLIVYKMNEIVNKFFLAGNKFVREMHLKQPGFTYSACGLFTKNKERIQNLKKREILTIFTKTNLIRLVFNIIWPMGILKI